ncbi:hypothetical protein [Mycolicibacterium fortuitum]|uniref:hypothetical protein n=1 Tax=Mycolicibacterium fortuitum TaxID=1766 RepID=UPI001AEF6B32|nr:hypothetical protein [Mycolicibacterium fortuitum]
MLTSGTAGADELAGDEDAADDGDDDVVPISMLPEHPAKTPINGKVATAIRRVIDCNATTTP